MSIVRPSFQCKHSAFSVQLRQELVTSLTLSGSLSSSALQQAFLAVPREDFVPCFYEEDDASRNMVWRHVCFDESTAEDYLKKVYRNEPLVTKMDERNWPVSSSSMPSAMAKMLEALDLQPGHRVLEIGTGTGYNAALLSMITGSPCNIVTMERDAVLATTAQQALEHCIGSGVTVVTGDGFAGWEQEVPYDRILVTANLPTLPGVWVEQLQPGGKIVMDLQGSLTASGFLIVEKTQEQVTGHFLPEPLYFMPLISEKIALVHPLRRANLLQIPCGEPFLLEKDHIFPAKLFDADFRWLLQWRLPGCQISRQKQKQRDTDRVITSIFVIDPTSRAMVRFQQQEGQESWTVNSYGVSYVWDDLQQLFAEFVALGEPEPHQYHVAMGQEGPFLSIGSLHMPL